MATLYSMLRILSIVAVLAAVVSGARSYDDDSKMDGPIIVHTDDQDSSESSYSSPSSYSPSYKADEPSHSSYKAPSTTYSKPSPLSHSNYQALSSTYQAPKPSYPNHQAPSTYQAPKTSSYSQAASPSYSSDYEIAEASSYAPYRAPASATTYEQPAPTYEASLSTDYEESEDDEYEYEEPLTIHDLRKLPRRVLNKYYKLIYSPIYQINRDAKTARDNNLVIRNDYRSRQRSGGYGSGGEENEDNYRNCISDIRARGKNALVNNLLFSCNGLLYNMFGSNGMNQEHPEPSTY